jgi:hypothetical protein
MSILDTFRAAAAAGGTVRLPAGTYELNSAVDGPVLLGGEALTIEGMGPQTILKRTANGLAAGRWSSQLTFEAQAGVDCPQLTFRNLSFDGNARAQPQLIDRSAVTYQYEQSATLRIQTRPGAKIREVTVSDCTFLDPVADDLLIGPSNGQRGIEEVLAENLRFGPRQHLRSSIIAGSACGEITIRNIQGDDTGAKSSRIETELSNLNPEGTNVVIRDAAIGRLEMGGFRTGVGLTADVRRVTCSEYAIFSWMRVDAEDCVLPVAPLERGRAWVEPFANIRNCSIPIPAVKGVLYPWLSHSLYPAIFDAVFAFTGCRFEIRSDGTPLTQVEPLVRLRPRKQVEGRLTAASFVDCRFDPNAPYSIDARGWPMLKTEDNIFAAAVLDYAIDQSDRPPDQRLGTSEDDEVVQGKRLFR